MTFEGIIKVLGVAVLLILVMGPVIAADSGKTMVIGEIYDQSFNKYVKDVRIWGICNQDESTVQENILVENSTFVLLFDSSACPAGSIISIGAYKINYEFFGAGGVVHECSDEDLCSDIFTVNGSQIKNIAVVNINLHLEKKVRIYTGGNGNLIKNTTRITEEVVQPQVQPQTQPEVITSIEQTEGNSYEEPIVPVEEQGMKGITGAFITDGRSSWLALIVILVASLVVYLLVRNGRNRRKVTLPSLRGNSDELLSFY
jgi:hypothetical protein